MRVLLIIRLLKMSPKLARAFRDFAIGLAALTTADLDAIKNWFQSTSDQQQRLLQAKSPLNQEIEALFSSYQGHMDVQHQVLALKRQMLNLPPLPDEGY